MPTQKKNKKKSISKKEWWKSPPLVKQAIKSNNLSLSKYARIKRLYRHSQTYFIRFYF